MRTNDNDITRRHSDGFLLRWLKRRYEPSLRKAIRHRKWVLLSALTATVLALWLASSFGTSFLPGFNEGTFTVFLMNPPGTSLVESDRVARGVEARLTAIPGVVSVTRRTGRAERDEHAQPPSDSEIDVVLGADARKENVKQQIHDILKDVPAIVTSVGQPIEHRLSHILSGTPAAIAMNIDGDDLGKLRSLAKQVETELKTLPGVRDVNAAREVMITSLPIRYRLEDLAANGITPASAAQQVQQALYGERVAEIHQGVRRYEMVVRLAAEDRQSVEHVRDLQLRGQDGALARLAEVADIGPEQTSNLIARENARRKAVISCNVVEGYNLGDTVEAVRQRVDPIVQAAGYAVRYGGQFEARQSAARTIYLAGAGVVVVMLLLLQLSSGSWRAAILVMANLPLALIGGIVAIYLTECENPFRNTLSLFGLSSARYEAPVISIASMIGFVTLFGIAVRNGILLVNHYQHLIVHECKPLAEAIIQGSMERLAPILMTALCAALGLLPLALARGEPGSELLAPLAIVVLGGLITSTFLNVVVVPAGYSLVFGSPRGDPERSVEPAPSRPRHLEGA